MKILKVLVTTFLLVSGFASAHSGLKTSTPKNGAMLAQSPEVLTLEFSADVRLVKLKLMDISGTEIKLTTKPGKVFTSMFEIPVPALTTGNYQVNWLAMGKDAHKMTGKFSFMVHASTEGITQQKSDGHSKHSHD